MSEWFGKLPQGVTVGFGARAIINRPQDYPQGECYLDLPPDRFAYRPTQGDDAEVEALAKFVVAAFTELRRRARTNEAALTDFTSSEEVTITLDAYPGFKMVANQKSSHGHLYLNAWRELAQAAEV